MEKQCCEIEAIGINYKIYNQKKNHHHDQRNHRDLDSAEQQQPLPTRPSPPFRQILNNVNLHAKPWEILAIVGPSGAGKSSLLEILAGKLTPHSGSILINQKSIDKPHFKKLSGYVTQKDTLFPLLTVEETLMFSAKFRLCVPRSQLEPRVKTLIQELGLSHVASARVGDDRVRGISGGERRRVSIGVDVVHDPKVLVLDEPTSGLDSTSAHQIIDMLKNMADTGGRTIVLSIHQPGFRIVKLFNSILMLANGTVLHHGTVDQLGVHLGLIGVQVPPHVNIVEFAIDSIDTIREHQQIENLVDANKMVGNMSSDQSRRSITLKQLFYQYKTVDHDEDIESAATPFSFTTRTFANSTLAETVILSQRFAKNIFRTKELFVCRTIQMLVAGLVLGSIFYDLKDDLTGAAERVGLFAFILTFLLSCTTEALPIFLQERQIVMKETSCGSYRVSSYAIANGLVYLPFLLILSISFTIPVYWLVGLNRTFPAFLHFLLLIWLILYTANSVVICFSALVPNFIVGNSVISGVMGSFFLFSGYFISKDEIPSYWKFMHYISLFKYPFEGFLINEFSGAGKCLEYMFGACVVSGEDVLREEGYEEKSRWRNVVIMVCFIMLYRFVSYVVLRFRCSQRSFKLK